MTQIKTTQFKCRRPSAFKTIFIVIAVMAITYSKVYIVCAQGLNAPWSVFRHDSLHTGRSTLQGPDSNYLKWSFHTENIVDSSAVLGRDRTRDFMQLNLMEHLSGLTMLEARYSQLRQSQKMSSMYAPGTEEYSP
jgi:hypothetical protein